jgi:hypothetical protein
LTDDEAVFIKPDESLKLEWAKRLGRAIQIKTISFNESTLSFDQLIQIHKFIQDNYPAIHNVDFIT